MDISVITRPLAALDTKLARLAEVGPEAWPKTLVFPELRQGWVEEVEAALGDLEAGDQLEVIIGADLEGLGAEGLSQDVAQSAVDRLHAAQKHAFDRIEVFDLFEEDGDDLEHDADHHEDEDALESDEDDDLQDEDEDDDPSEVGQIGSEDAAGADDDVSEGAPKRVVCIRLVA